MSRVTKETSLTEAQVRKIAAHILDGATRAANEGFDRFEVVSGVQFCLGVMIEKIDLNAPVSKALPLLALGISASEAKRRSTTH